MGRLMTAVADLGPDQFWFAWLFYSVAWASVPHFTNRKLF